MSAALAFFGIATLIGCVIRGVGELRIRIAARRPNTTEADLCSLERANRISSVTVLCALAGLALLGLAYALA